MTENHKITVIFLTVFLLLQSCAVKKFIPEDERLYTGASVEIKSDSVIDNKENLETVLEEALRPEPNSKFLGMRPGLHFYYKMQQQNPGFINRFFYKRIGEEPVYQSDVKPFEVEEILRNRMENRGFFYSQISSEFEEKEMEASINYTVKAPTPYTIASYQLDSLPRPIYSEIKQSVGKTKLSKGMRFDLSNMKLERERIDNDLKHNGYYNFNANFLIFEADTNQYDRKKFDLYLRLKKEVPNKAIVPYKISKINVYANYNSQDTTTTEVTRFNEKNFINSADFFNPKYLDPFITLEEGQFYSPEDSRNTSRRLATIGAYKFVNIQYKEKDSSLTDSLGILEANIFLSPLNKRAIRAELQAVTKSNSFAGPGLAVTYSNRNLFNGGETLNTTASFGYEVQLGSGSNSGNTSINLGLKSELIFPRVIFPIKIDTDFFEYAIPKTKTSVGVDYLSRTKLYTLLSGTAQFGYIWQANKYVTHEIIPISINYTKPSNTSPEFEEILDENPFLKRSFDQQFISGLNYSFTYNGMVDTAKKNQFFLNATVDVAGNSISLFGKENEMGKKEFLGLEYAQFAKFDADFRYHFNFGKEQVIATRLFGGYGYAYGNSDIIPYVKQYYSGGPYSVRAFRIRSLGPGTYNDAENPENNYFDQTGNIRLEANIEYRFPIISYLKGAVFADAGNIWNSKANPVYHGADKFTSNFINELGMGAGVGLRVDVQGFVIRFDFAAPFHDPSTEEGFNFDVNETVFNFGIGYPF
ncbi:BamA/TamA family outer membrane protein [Aequorivita iocasae]|uniref:BamA/TamA family outer membrane protein n=1 Tax=Aequorivita iocasae TaxID=2803865 RepID=A0ABX7DQ41_9FLAO|nr:MULTISPECIES: BamA/TamA family outer membrane protein [Aequorivita]QQX76260.1 BamA/TamA family outer membrane protein [Aequorivita iocasae]UCA55723.1 BamA/TamA family outer membrane protein [Aequorivita sp. F7]